MSFADNDFRVLLAIVMISKRTKRRLVFSESGTSDPLTLIDATFNCEQSKTWAPGNRYYPGKSLQT